MKQTIAVMFGGKSPEHQISLLSSQNIVRNIDRVKFDILLIGISKEGKMFLYDENYLENKDNAKTISLKESNEEIVFLSNQIAEKRIYNFKTEKYYRVDLVFPIMHGKNGEDGSLQGMMEFLGIPYVSSTILPSALTMDKDLTKKILTQVGIKNAKYQVFNIWEKAKINFVNLRNELKLPMFVKPARCGSSVGVSKIKNEKEFEKAIELAFSFDEKILIEEALVGKEIECSVIGKEEIITPDIVGEIVPNNEDGFYTYNAKYIDENGAILNIPASLSQDEMKKIIKICKKAYQAVGLDLLARVDGFLLSNGEFYINEINSIPGFTNISMFPKLFEASGISQKKLISQMIELALLRE